MDQTVAGAGVTEYDVRWLRQLDVEPWWIEELVKAEQSIRRLRTQLEALAAESPRTCARCRQPMGGRADRKYCSDRCRIEAHRSRRRKQPQVDDDLVGVLTRLEIHYPRSVSDLTRSLYGLGRRKVERLVSAGVAEGLLSEHEGPRGARLFRLTKRGRDLLAAGFAEHE